MDLNKLITKRIKEYALNGDANLLDQYGFLITMIAKEYAAQQLILSGVSDIVHRAELKVLENVSDYIPCEIYSQAVISSQKKRDNVR
jgi:hypothetical protein